jgi:uncharacterized protein YvpB
MLIEQVVYIALGKCYINRLRYRGGYMGKRKLRGLYITVIVLLIGVIACILIIYYTGDFNNIFSSRSVVANDSSVVYESGETVATKEATISKEQAIANIQDAYKNKEKAYIDVKWLSQYPELPTGCEITSLTTVLNYYGYDVSKVDMARKYLKKGSGSFRNMFVGNPERDDGFGCYAKPIVDAANKYFKTSQNKANAVNLSNSTFETLLGYVAMDTPVLVWNTIGMSEPQKTASWDTEDGTVTWISPEHCVVLIGYDKIKKVVYVSDPMEGIIERDLNVFKQRYEQMCKQAVYVAIN